MWESRATKIRNLKLKIDKMMIKGETIGQSKLGIMSCLQ